MRSSLSHAVLPIQVPLTKMQRDLLIGEVTVPPRVASLLEDGFKGSEKVTVSLSPDDLQDIVSEAEEAVHKATDEQTRLQLIDLCDHLLAFDPEYLGEQLLLMADDIEFDEEARVLFEMLAHGLESKMLSPSSVHRILDLLASGETSFRPRDLFPELLTLIGDEPVEDQGGLTPAQVIQLSTTPVDSKESPLKLNPNVDLEGHPGPAFVVFVRYLLRVIHDAKKVKATKAGNLNRKFVRNLLQGCRAEGLYDLPGQPADSDAGEKDIFELHLARCLLEEEGYIVLKKGAFHITDAGKTIIGQPTGMLFAVLFKAICTIVNLGYFDDRPEVSSFQDTIAYPLYRFSKEASEYKTIGELAPALLFPAVTVEMGPASHLMMCEFLLLRFFRFLNVFGLVEAVEPEVVPIPATELLVRKSPLFDQFISFTFD